MDEAAGELREAGVEATKPRYDPEYAPDYYVRYLKNPDGVRLGVTNFREVRCRLMYDWEPEITTENTDGSGWTATRKRRRSRPPQRSIRCTLRASLSNAHLPKLSYGCTGSRSCREKSLA
jgi:hypothetical protein